MRKISYPRILVYHNLQDRKLLRSVSEPVVDFGDNLKQIADQLKIALLSAPLQVGMEGVGLSAVQIGILKRIFVVFFDDGTFRFFVNPKIKPVGDEKITDTEGCLSIPDVLVPVPRYEKIKITYQDLEGNTYKEIYKGFYARVIQHEVDHLDGKLIIDYSQGNVNLVNKKGDQRDSNPRPPAPQAGALPLSYGHHRKAS